MARGRILWLVCGVLLLIAARLFQGAVEDAAIPRADLVIGNGAEPQSLDPAAATAIPESRVLHCLFEGLVVPDPRTLEPRPAMAESWRRSEDGLTWTFRLRPGLRWSDGRPISAPDLRWSLLRVLDPATGAEYASMLYPVRGARAYTKGGRSRGPLRDAVAIRAPDARTLEFGLERRTPWFLSLLTSFALYPVPRHVLEQHGNAWVETRNFVSNGPFRLRLRRLQDRIRVEKNPLYWDAANVRLETIDLLAVQSKTTLLNLYSSGLADWICDVPESAVPTVMERFGPSGTGEYDPRNTFGTYYYKLNTSRVPLTSVKVRRALALAIDRAAIVKNVTRSGELPAHSFTPPGVPGYTPPDVLRRDVDQARRLMHEGLQDLGLESCPTLELLYNTRAMHRSIAEVIQHQWSEVLGVEVRLRNMEWAAFQAATRTLDYMVARASWIGDFLDPATFAEVYVSGVSSNQSAFSDALYDRLVLEDSRQVADPRERERLLQDAERRLLELMPIIPIFHDVSRNLVKPWVRGFHGNVLDLHLPRFMRIEGRAR